jgi:uncharacterized protein YecE (DUF72 family)
MIEARAKRDMPRADVHIGCSGWQYRHWRGRFYPASIPQTKWFEYYASQFDTVEINNTFYRLPERSTFKAWKSRAPRQFRFSIKASRFLTHMKRLNEPKESIERLFAHARVLGHTLGPMLYQLPTGWPLNIDRLTVFLNTLPPRRRHAIEFRDPSWYTGEVFALLARYRVTCCLHDMAGSASGPVVVGPFVYLRLHGTAKYSGRYPDRTLMEWASWLVEQLRCGRPVFAYFNNDASGDAPYDAVRLRDFVKRAFPDGSPR